MLKGDLVDLSNSSNINSLKHIFGVAEGKDVSFDCVDNTLSQPNVPEPKLIFKKNDEMIPSAMSSSSLKLFKLTNSDDGVYHCEIENSVGIKPSNSINLKVICKFLKLKYHLEQRIIYIRNISRGFCYEYFCIMYFISTIKILLENQKLMSLQGRMVRLVQV